MVGSPKECLDYCKTTSAHSATVDTRSKSNCVCGYQTTETNNDTHWKTCIFRSSRTTVTTVPSTAPTTSPVKTVTMASTTFRKTTAAVAITTGMTSP